MIHKKKKRFDKKILGLFVFILLASVVLQGFMPTSTRAQAQLFSAACELKPGTKYASLPEEVFVPWYKYLEGDDEGGRCAPSIGSNYVGAISLIALAVLDTLLRISGLLATAYLIWGAIQYITSQGEQGGIANAKNTILNAIVGLVIVLLSIGIVQFVGNLAR